MSDRIAIVGASGFVGSHVIDELQRRDFQVTSVDRELLEPLRKDFDRAMDLSPGELAGQLNDLVRSLAPAEFEPLVDAVNDCHCLINAAGRATPLADMTPELLWANAALPVFLRRAVELSDAGKRLVHLSSAAVQGNRSELDETTEVDPLTPYARTKAAAELALLNHPSDSCTTVVYRPTSVHGPRRALTDRLKKLLCSPLMPRISGSPNFIPVTSAKSVARASVLLATEADISSGIVLHPTEGISQAMMVDFASPRSIRMRAPAAALGPVLQTLESVPVPRVQGTARRLSVATVGQRVKATKLVDYGFELVGSNQLLHEMGLNE